MQQRRRIQLVQQRRKWSDWSECSPRCLKTRHRINCDDLERPRNGTITDEQTSLEGIEIIGSSKAEGKKELLLQVAGEQADEDDYADEGDEEEEEETDSCAHVEPSRTFEEASCTDGSCRMVGQTSGQQPARPIANRQRLSKTRTVVQQTTSGPQNGTLTRLFGVERPPPPQTIAQINGTSSMGSWPIGWQLPVGDPGPQFRLLQWTILLGLLLFILLLIALLLRKLLTVTLPSYHWRVAKQTLASARCSSMPPPSQLVRDSNASRLIGAETFFNTDFLGENHHHQVAGHYYGKPLAVATGFVIADSSSSLSSNSSTKSDETIQMLSSTGVSSSLEETSHEQQQSKATTFSWQRNPTTSAVSISGRRSLGGGQSHQPSREEPLKLIAHAERQAQRGTNAKRIHCDKSHFYEEIVIKSGNKIYRDI